VGCAAFTDGPAACVEASCVERPQSVGGLIRYAQALRALDAPVQQGEYQRVESRFARQPTAINRLMLALLLSTPETTFRNDARSRELLAEYVELNRDDGAYRDFAAFLLRGLNERYAMEQAMEGERRLHQQLRKQVEELKAIEQHMNQRDQLKERAKP
jgi:hypothetical protein